MVRRFLLTFGFVVVLLSAAVPSPVAAEVPTPSPNAIPQTIVDLSSVLKMADVVAVLREEGLRNGAELAVDLPGGPQDAAWKALLSRLYDVSSLKAKFDAGFAGALRDSPEMTIKATEFFASPLGQKVMGLEIDARRTLLDPDIEAAAKLSYAGLAKENPARQALLDRFVVVNDLIESNVMGSLNSNLAFFRGLAEEGGEKFEMSESDMVEDVWADEAKTRQETIDWLMPFLAMAYKPLSDAELQAYVDFSDTPAGRKINGAMFVAFDALFNGISLELGRAVARQMDGQDI